jgi:hypothetical protein
MTERRRFRVPPAGPGDVEPGVSAWANTQMQREVKCPHCNAEPGFHCTQPSGIKAHEPHGLRLRAYRDKIGQAEFLRRHRRPHHAG